MSKQKLIISLLTAAGVLNCACTEKQWGEFQKDKYNTDITRVVCFYSPDMWQSFDRAGDRNPEGFKIVMYLVSETTGKGVYADGTIHIMLFQIDHGPDESVTRSLAQEWTASTDDLPRREPRKLGCSYQPSLYWGDKDLYGREVEIVVQYESPDGIIVQSQTHFTKIPARRV